MPALNISDLNNAKQDVDHIAEVATSLAATATDRFGHAKPTVAAAVASIASINVRGAWASGVNYAPKDVVGSGGTWYICLSAHTSGGSFATDEASKWRIYQGPLASEVLTPVASISGLRATNKGKFDAVHVGGYYQKGDGGGGAYYYDSTDTTSTDNGGTVIVATDGGRWKLAHSSRVSVKQFGAKGDDVSNDTAALKAAIAWAKVTGRELFVPVGTYRIDDTLIFDTGVYTTGIIMRGEGRNSIIRQVGAGKDAIHFSSTQVLQNSGISDLAIVCDSAAGHVINFVKGATTCFFRNLDLTQMNPAKAIYYGDFSVSGDGVYDTEFAGGNYYLPGGNTATEAGFRIKTRGTLFNENVFKNLRCYYAGVVQFFHITGVSGSGYWLTNNSFENINFEVCKGGGLLCSNAKNFNLKNITFWDAGGAYTNHLVDFVAGNGYESTANVLTNVARNGDSLSAGVRDIRIVSGQDFVMVNCYTQAGDAPSYDFGGKRVTVIGRMANVLNGTGAITIRPDLFSSPSVYADDAYADTLHVGGRSAAESARVYHSGGYTSIETIAASTGVILSGKDGAGNFKKLVWTATEMFPLSDNVHTLGISSNRWTTIYASTATINTSDERAKQRVQPIDEAALRAWGKVQYCQYKFNDAVQAKGDGARWHFGVIAQRVKEAFESEGLDPFAYGILCFDKWEARAAVVDEAGNEILPAATAGEMYGVRYEEALALECAYLRSRIM